ncbi:MAG: PAS domain-containing protein, partial [Verrucomicrobia bacterium]|nr:PAS domain-containing protein [Verrucomicrobiota bacterium]
LAVAIWTFSVLMGLLSARPTAQQFWVNIGFLGVVALSPAWLAFALAYTGRGAWLTRSVLTWLALVPAITLALVFIPATHELILKRDWVNGVVRESYGAWFWVFAGFAYVCNLASLVLLLLKLVHSPPLYRQQTMLVLLGGLTPWAANLLHLAGLVPRSWLDPTPFSFALSGLLLAWGLFHFRLLEITPVARDAVIEHMNDAMLVLDAQDRIVDCNPAAQRLFHTTARQAIGQTAAVTLRDCPDLVRRLRETGAVQTEIALGQANDGRAFDLRVSPLFDRRNRFVGRLAMLRDMTERRQAEQERERLIQELQDALGNVNLLSGLLPICASCKRIRDDRGYWNQLESFIQRRSSAKFTHGLCPDCVQKLYPEIAQPGTAESGAR